MAKCTGCVHHELCYMIEHYGREEDEDIECRRFKAKDEYIKVQHGMWIKEGNKRTCTRCGYDRRYKVHERSKILPWWWYIECRSCRFCSKTKLFLWRAERAWNRMKAEGKDDE